MITGAVASGWLQFRHCMGFAPHVDIKRVFGPELAALPTGLSPPHPGHFEGTIKENELFLRRFDIMHGMVDGELSFSK